MGEKLDLRYKQVYRVMLEKFVNKLLEEAEI